MLSFVEFNQSVLILLAILSHFQYCHADVFGRDFRIFSKRVCKSNCSILKCYPKTFISIEKVEEVDNKNNQYRCNPSNSMDNIPLNLPCHFKFIKTHVVKRCSHNRSCQICGEKIPSPASPKSECSSEIDFIIHYRCIPMDIQVDNICTNSYRDFDCLGQIEERLVIINVTLHSDIRPSNQDPRGCRISKQFESSVPRSLDSCPGFLDKTNEASRLCSFRSKCSLGPDRMKIPSGCAGMHMRVTHACVPRPVLQRIKVTQPSSITEVPLQKINKKSPEDDTWFKKNKWLVLGLATCCLFSTITIVTAIVCVSKRRRNQRSFHINANSSSGQKESSVFNKLTQSHFVPPPSSIDRVVNDFDIILSPPDLYNTMNMRDNYSGGGGSHGDTPTDFNRQQKTLVRTTPPATHMSLSSSSSSSSHRATRGGTTHPPPTSIPNYYNAPVINTGDYFLPHHHNHHQHHHLLHRSFKNDDNEDNYPNTSDIPTFSRTTHTLQYPSLMTSYYTSQTGNTTITSVPLLEMCKPTLPLLLATTDDNVDESINMENDVAMVTENGDAEDDIGTPRGTAKSSGIFSMNENVSLDFVNTHQV